MLMNNQEKQSKIQYFISQYQQNGRFPTMEETGLPEGDYNNIVKDARSRITARSGITQLPPGYETAYGGRKRRTRRRVSNKKHRKSTKKHAKNHTNKSKSRRRSTYRR